MLTLTTDFGLGDHFAGVMKGVILRINPKVRIVDLSHEVSAYDTGEAAFLLAQSYRYFPKKTVHVAVVDPGVGSARRPILVEAAGQYFVGPDNGLFSMILERENHTVRAITAERYFLKPVSNTFHGRDIFAPVGAHLSKGLAPAKLGKRIDDFLRPASHKPVRTARRGWTGAILKIDRFGNLITNFHVDDFPFIQSRPFEMQVGLRMVTRLASHYAECGPGETFVIAGSSGYLEVSASQAS
ncbi:MAG: SAM-dependent chlorinase/fluorinase, partial [Candidatus Solibacter usitatus]|nr:SAM-dependent chlorinase/fluorinase [Candidatus Solibacter usitatus]